MNLLSKLTDIVGGSLFKEVKEIINDRWPPEISPEKRAEIEFALGELQAKSQQAAGQLALEQLRAELSDVQDARKNHASSNMPATITIVMTIISVMYGVGLFYCAFPPENRDMINHYGGQMITLWVGSVVYWIGTTRSSQEKNRIIAQSDPVK
jgi:hypothetical protein